MDEISDSSISRVLTFKTGDILWALTLDQLQEIIHLPRLTNPPVESQFIAGFLELTGEQIPVIRLAALLSLSQTPDSLYTPILILKGISMALLVDEVGELLDVTPGSFRRMPREHVLNDFVEAEFSHQESAIYLVDPHKVLLQEEKLRLRELQAARSRRLTRLGPTP